MTLTGRLDQFDFADLLQMLAAARKSGKLSLTQYAGRGVIVLRHGKIIYAASSAARETLGHILLCEGLITEEQLKESLERQHSVEQERRLGAILVDLGFLSQEALEKVVREQVEAVISEFLGWSSGFFRFEELEFPDRGEVEVDAREFLLDEGLPADQVLLGLTVQLETPERAATTAPAPDRDDAGQAEAVREQPPEIIGLPTPGDPSSLRSVMLEFHSPEFTGEVTLKVLDFARRIVRRGVLFSTSRRGFVGLGQFGVDPPGGAPPDFVRQIAIPLDQPSVLKEAIARKTAYRGPLEETRANRLLSRYLGGGWPQEALSAPLIVSGRVLLVIYGDNLPGSDPIASPEDLELVLLHAGLAMEKAVLAKRIEYLEAVRRHS